MSHRFPSSDLYRWPDKAEYLAQREERMISQLDDFFWKCFFMLRANAVDGDYLEFGCGSNVRSFRLAWKYRQLEIPAMQLFAFDSFEGLPEPKGIDKHPGWMAGAMAVTQDEFQDVLKSSGAQPNEYQMIPGFYSDSLQLKTPSDYGIQQAAMVFVDCDLYESSKKVLQFVAPCISDGAVLAFDDWFCYKGKPDRGEQRAFHEFKEENPQLRFAPYQSFGWHGYSFLVHHV